MNRINEILTNMKSYTKNERVLSCLAELEVLLDKQTAKLVTKPATKKVKKTKQTKKHGKKVVKK